MSVCPSITAFISTSPNSQSVDALGDILSCPLLQKMGWGDLWESKELRCAISTRQLPHQDVVHHIEVFERSRDLDCDFYWVQWLKTAR